MKLFVRLRGFDPVSGGGSREADVDPPVGPSTRLTYA